MSLTAGAAWPQAPDLPAGPMENPQAARPAAVERLATALDLGPAHIVLQSTSLPQVQAQLGGGIREQGEPGVAVRSLCYYQPGSPTPWALWLESSQLYHGDVIHSFRWARLAPGTVPEAGCVALRPRSDAVLAAGLRLGQTREALLTAFGAPVTETPATLLYLRAGLTVMEDTLFTVQSRAFMTLDAGRLDAVEVSKSTSLAQ